MTTSPKNHLYRLALAFALPLLAAPSLSAQTDGVWIQSGSGVWSTPANWQDGNIADGAGSTADFSTLNIGATATVTIDTTSRTLGILNLGDTNNTHSYIVAASGGAGLTFDNGAAGAQINLFSTSFNNTISAPVTLNDSLTINNLSSSRALTISGAISAGTAGVKTITYTGNSGTGGTLSGAIGDGSGSVAIVQNSAGTTLTLSNASNTYTGTTSVLAGTLAFSSNSHLGSATSQILLGDTGGSSNAALSNTATADTTISRGIRIQGGNTGAASINISGSGTITHTYTGGIVLGTNDGAGHGLTLNSGSSFGTLNINSAISDPANVLAGTAGSLTIVSGTNSRVRLSTANSYSGGTILSSTGRLSLNNNGALGSGTLTVNGGEFAQTFGSYTSNTNNAMIWNANFSASGSLTVDMGTGAVNLGATGTDTTRTITSNNTGSTGLTGFVVRGVISDGTNGFTTNLTKGGTGILSLGGASNYTGNTSITGGTLRLVSGNNRLPTGTILSINSGANLDLNTRSQSVAGLTGSGFVQNNASGTSTLTVTDTSTFGGVIRNNSGTGGTVALTKSTGGILTLTGANTYTGATSVTGGTLIVGSGGTGSLGNTAVTVAVGATLGGSGSIAGNVTINGDIAPGNSPGTLSTGNLTLASTASLIMELGALAGVNDLLAVTGNLTLDGTLNVANLGGLEVGQYTLITYTGTLTDLGLELGSMPGAFNYTISTDSANVFLNVMPVPEPSMCMLLALGFFVLAARRKARA